MVLQHSCVFQYLTRAWLSSNAQIRMPPILNFCWEVAGLGVSWQLLLPPESRAHCVKNFSPALLLCHAQGYHICGFLHKHPLLASGTFVSVNFRIFLYILELWQSSWSKWSAASPDQAAVTLVSEFWWAHCTHTDDVLNASTQSTRHSCSQYATEHTHVQIQSKVNSSQKAELLRS